jgi:formiminotetrahydrofolate cyclodeaminase
MRFVKGQSGNPLGKPLGSRNKLKEAFWVDFNDTWMEHGRAALATVAVEDPSTFVKVAASIMPKETELTMREIRAADLSDDALAAIALGGN